MNNQLTYEEAALADFIALFGLLATAIVAGIGTLVLLYKAGKAALK